MTKVILKNRKSNKWFDREAEESSLIWYQPMYPIKNPSRLCQTPIKVKQNPTEHDREPNRETKQKKEKIQKHFW